MAQRHWLVQYRNSATSISVVSYQHETDSQEQKLGGIVQLSEILLQVLQHQLCSQWHKATGLVSKEILLHVYQ